MFDELRHFLLVSTHGTFTEAARRAHLSQPALSASIKRLEEAMGAKLLDRGPRGATPTPAGRALQPWAEAALGAVAQGERAVAEILGLRTGRVRLGGGATACTYLLPPILTAFRAAHPGIELFLQESPSARARRGVAAGQLDLAIVSDPEGAEPWREDPLMLVGAPSVVGTDAPHLTFPRGANHRELLDEHFPDATIAMELNSLVAVKAHALAGMGIALLSAAAVERDVAEGRLVALDDPRTPLGRTLYLLHAGRERLSPAAGALRQALLDAAA